MDNRKGTLSRRTFLKVTGAALAAGVGTSLLPQLAASAQKARPNLRFAQKSIDITFWVIPYWKGKTGKEPDGKDSDYYTWQIEEFNKQYPIAKITPTFIPSTFEGWSKFDAAVASGNAP